MCACYSSEIVDRLASYTAKRVDAHNAKRNLHVDTNPVTAADIEVSCQAYWWANKMAEEEFFDHAYGDDRPSDQGENLAKSASWGRIHAELVPEIGWYDEEEPNYNYATGGSNGGVIGHFTQMVWRETTEIGCAERKIQRENAWNYTYSVCRYNPTGNWIGEYTEQVGDLK